MSDKTQRKTSLPTGFGGSYDEYAGDELDLIDLLIETPSATFFMRVDGDGMKGAHINNGAVIVVDRSLEPRDGDIIVAVLEGEMLIRTLQRSGGDVRLYKEQDCEPTIITNPDELDIWGVVTASINQYR